jgi:hypothetical protein
MYCHRQGTAWVAEAVREHARNPGRTISAVVTACRPRRCGEFLPEPQKLSQHVNDNLVETNSSLSAIQRPRGRHTARPRLNLSAAYAILVTQRKARIAASGKGNEYLITNAIYAWVFRMRKFWATQIRLV